MRKLYFASVALSVAFLRLLGAGAVTAQIRVDSTTVADHNHLTSHASLNPPALPLSDDMGNTGDLFVAYDVEVGDALYLSSYLYLQGDATPSEADQFISFANNGSRDGEFLAWIDGSADRFQFSNDIALSNDTGANHPLVQITAVNENELQLLSQAPEMRFLIDADADDDASALSHIFTWSNNNLNANQRAMILQSNTGAVGYLYTAGPITENFSFDLAETFWSGRALAPGTLVAIDPARPDAVVPATRESSERLLGVVSTRPGIVMGGGAFSVEALRENWGAEVAELFQAERAALEQKVLLNSPVLQRTAQELASFETFALRAGEQSRALPRPATSADAGSPAPAERSVASSEELETAHRDAVLRLETRLQDEAMRRFFRRRFTPVALAGRIPVRVDATFGPIQAGDPLTISPTPGVGMKAQTPGPVVGTALEPHRQGPGIILMLVHKGWLGGPAVEPSYAAGPARPAHLRAELAALREEVDALRETVRGLQRSAVQPPRLAELEWGGANDRHSP